MAFLAPLAGLAMAGMGIAQMIKGNKPPAPVAAPAAPKPIDAAAAATEAAKKRRLQMSKTDMTSGSALVPETNLGLKSLVGQ